MSNELRQERDELCRKFSERIKALRLKEFGERKAWAAAEVIGVTNANYSHFESGRFLPSLPIVLRICKAYGITPNELLEGMY